MTIWLQIMLKKKTEIQKRMQILRSGHAWLQQTSIAMRFSVSAEQKGGSSLPRLVRELYNVTVRVGGQSVVLQGDQENSVQAVVRGVEQLRSKNQLQAVVRYAEKGQPMSNGRAERAVRTLKEMSRALRQHVFYKIFPGHSLH